MEDTATEIPGKGGARGGEGGSPQQAVDEVPGRTEEAGGRTEGGSKKRERNKMRSKGRKVEKVIRTRRGSRKRGGGLQGSRSCNG